MEELMVGHCRHLKPSYGTLEERGHRFEAHIVSGHGDPVTFELRVFIGDELKYTLATPMVYVPSFGAGVGDVQMLEGVTVKVLVLPPVPEHFGAEAVAALERA